MTTVKHSGEPSLFSRQESGDFFASGFTEVRKLYVELDNDVSAPARVLRVRQTLAGDASHGGRVYHVRHGQCRCTLAQRRYVERDATKDCLQKFTHTYTNTLTRQEA